MLIIIAILGIVIYKLLHQKEERDRLPAENLVVAGQETPAVSPLFTTDMNMVWSFPSGKRVSKDAVIGNSSKNEYDIYFEVYLVDDQDTLLYSSQILPVGTRLDKLELDKALPDGQHEAICTFHMLDKEDPNKEVSDISFNVTLIFGDGVTE